MRHSWDGIALAIYHFSAGINIELSFFLGGVNIIMRHFLGVIHATSIRRNGKKTEQYNIDATKIGTLQSLFQLKVAHYDIDADQ